MELEKISLDIQPSQYQELATKQFGNHTIYAKIPSSVKWNDPRLKVLDPDYFYRQNVLDIGCNQGILTIPIAMKFRPQFIKGIDIDTHLITRCANNLQKFQNKSKDRLQNLPKKMVQQIEELPLYFQEKLSQSISGQIITHIPQIEFKPQDEVQVVPKFPENIAFEALNFLSPKCVQYYDTILCMNVTKWMHLAFGDDAMKRLFGNISTMLHEGGTLILEVQPWSSYRKKRNLYKSYKLNYDKISYKPEKFRGVLKTFGLFHVNTIEATAENQLKHNISIYKKKGFYCSDLVL